MGRLVRTTMADSFVNAHKEPALTKLRFVSTLTNVKKILVQKMHLVITSLSVVDIVVIAQEVTKVMDTRLAMNLHNTVVIQNRMVVSEVVSFFLAVSLPSKTMLFVI